MPHRAATVLFVVVAMTFPTAMALVYFLAMGGTGKPSGVQQFAYAAGKVFQFSLPLLFVLFVTRQRPVWERPSRSGILLGLGFGLLVGGAMLAAYYGGLRSSSLLAQAPGRIRAKLSEFDIATPAAFLGLAVFLAVAHSFLEEYYWRWFVFGQLSTLMPSSWAIVVSSVGFMSHHVLILYAYLPDRILTGVIPGSLAVAVGGVAWAWLYRRAGSLVAPWVSHALVDAALFVIGWDMVFAG